MTTESGADSDPKQEEKGKAKAASQPGQAAAAASPQTQPEQLPAAAGHSTPAKKEQVGLHPPHAAFPYENELW